MDNECIYQSFQDIPMDNRRHREFKRPGLKKKRNHTGAAHHLHQRKLSHSGNVKKEISETDDLLTPNDVEKSEEAPSTGNSSAYGRGIHLKKGKPSKVIHSGKLEVSNEISFSGKIPTSADIELRAKKVMRKIEELKTRYSNSKYLENEIEEEGISENFWQPEKSGRFVNISRKSLSKRPALGRGIAGNVGETSEPQNEAMGRGVGAPPVGNTADPSGNDPKGDVDIDDNNDEAPPVRVWGDECTPNLENEGDDECSQYTQYAFVEKNNGRQLSCDADDKICLCLSDDKGNRAEFSKELEICLVPRFYTCKTTQECAPLLTCSKATKRDYELDPQIPPDFPKICRLMLNTTSMGVVTLSDDRLSLVNMILLFASHLASGIHAHPGSYYLK